MSEENLVIKHNEHEANRFVANIMLITAGVFTLIFILNVIGVFIIKTRPMVICYSAGMVLLMVPVVLVKILKLETPAIKFISVTVAALFVAILTITLNYHAAIASVFAIGIASLYFTRSVNIYATVLSILLCAGSQFAAYKLQFTLDYNEIDLYSTLVYIIGPRAICLFSMALIFLSLNSRTTKMMKNFLDADSQAKMIKKMENMQEKSSVVSETLVNTVEALLNVTTDTTDSNAQIAVKTEQAADGSGKTLEKISEAGNNITGISDNLVKLAANTNEINVISNNVKTMTDSNTENMDKAFEGFKQISSSTEKTKELIQELEDKSQEIKNIVEVITTISERTNLLALNATIESARAGEQGRGFAVVATEISKLSDQTNEAVSNISTIIEEVVSNTNNAAAAMEESVTHVNSGMEIIRSASDSTKMVTKETLRMHQKITEIDEAARQVSENSEKIVGIIKDVENISSENLDNLEKVTASNEQGLDNMKKLQELVGTIKGMSDDLDKVVHM